MSMRGQLMRSVYGMSEPSIESIAHQIVATLQPFIHLHPGSFDLYGRVDPNNELQTQLIAARSPSKINCVEWNQVDAWEVVAQFDSIPTSSVQAIINLVCPLIPNHNGWDQFYPTALAWPKPTQWLVLSIDEIDLGEPIAVFSERPPTPPRPLSLPQIFDSSENRAASIRRHMTPEQAIDASFNIVEYRRKHHPISFIYALDNEQLLSASD